MTFSEFKVNWLLFELDNLQVYTIQTEYDWMTKIPYTEVYWKKKNEIDGWGPFKNIADAMNHFIKYRAFLRTLPKDNVIYVDFRAKKRITP